jgi:hypothetical protein
MFELLTQPGIKKRIEEKSHLILPKTRWDGFKKESGVLEVYEPGTREDTGYKPRLDRGEKKVEAEAVQR